MARKFALIIGNSHYQDPNLAKLVAPGEDVADLTEVLRNVAIGGFDQVSPLINETDAAIRLGLEDFFADKQPDDLLVVYFSGHGVRDEQGQLYLAVNNTRANRLRATAIPSEFITKEMDRSRSRRQVLILDCCHSGAFAQGAKAVTGESAGTGPAFEGNGYGRVVLTATDATQYAWEGDKIIGQADNSLFTHFMVEGLRTGAADVNGDGQITLDEMYDYVYERVVTRTPKQTPGKWSYRQQGDIVIARNPRSSVKPAELPADLKIAIDSSLVNVRLGAVRELDRLLAAPTTALTPMVVQALKHLAEDDSRSVSSAASTVLQIDTEKQGVRQTPAHREQAQAEAIRLTSQAEQERQARLTAERERIEARMGRVEQPLIQPLAPIGTRPPEQITINVRVWSSTLLLAVVFGLSWALAFPMFSQPATQLTAVVLAGVTPIVTLAVSLRRSGLPLKWQHFFALGAGWLVGLIVAVIVAVPIPVRVDTALKFGVLFGAVCGAIGGVVTGLIVRQLLSGLGRISLRSITLGWMMAWIAGFGWFFVWSMGLGVLRSPYSDSTLTLYIGLTGAFIGAVGGGITYRQINRVALSSG